MSEQHSEGSNQVFRVLTEVGQRSRTARLLPLLVFTLAIGVAALGGAILYLGGDWTAVAWQIAGLTTVCCVALTAAVFAVRPGPGVVARRIDYSLGLSEQLSSAMDMARRGSASPVVRSLFERAGWTASQIDPARAVPLRTPLLWASLVALLASAGATGIAYALRGDVVSLPTQSVEETVAATQPAIAAEDLDILAELVAEDAERRDSDYLEALSNSIEALARQAREGQPQAELQAQLQALMDHAAAGYSGDNPEWFDQGENAGAVLQNAVAFNTERQQAAERRARLAERAGEGTRISSADMYTLSDDRMSRSATPPPAGNAPPSDNAMAAREGELQSESLAGGETLARPMEDEAFTSAGSLPVGAAAQSGKGESNIAGGGSQALADSSAFLETMADPTQTMSIAAESVSEGSRIRMHVPTSAELSAAGDLSSTGPAGWERQLAQVVGRQVIGPDASAAVAHYFNRPPAGQEP
jgi:hypothetical protein